MRFEAERSAIVVALWINLAVSIMVPAVWKVTLVLALSLGLAYVMLVMADQ